MGELILREEGASSSSVLAGKTPTEVYRYLQEGRLLDDTPHTADLVLGTLFPQNQSPYYEIAMLGLQYEVRTRDRQCVFIRAPRTLGGVMLLLASAASIAEQATLYVATGGKGHF